MFNTFSLPGFQCIDGLLLPEHLQLSVGRNSDSILPELFPTVEQYIPISLLLFLKLDYQSLFIDISLPWSDDNTFVQECRGILAARCASCNCMTRTSAILPKAISAGGFTPSWYTECALWSVFPIQISPFSNNLYFRLTLLYHGLCHRTSVLFIFSQFISHLQRKENSCYIYVKMVLELRLRYMGFFQVWK